MKAQVIPFRKNLNLSRFNVAPVEWRRIRTNDNKKLSSSEIELLWTIHRLAIYHNTNNLELSYSVLDRECGLDVSQRQLNRYLHKLSSTEIIDFYTRKSVVNYDKKLIIKIDFEILKNLMTVKFDRQVCQSNMSGYNIDKNKLQSKEVGERAFSYLSPTSRKERNKNKKEKSSTLPQEQSDLLCYPEGAASQPCSIKNESNEAVTVCNNLELITVNPTVRENRTTEPTKSAKVIALTPSQERDHYRNHQGRDVESQVGFTPTADIFTLANLLPPATCAISAHVEPPTANRGILSQFPNNPQEENAMKAYDWDNPANKLDHAIAKNFDINTAQELTINIDYDYIALENKMRLVFKKKLAISEQNKNRLKQLIKDIYGDDTEIVCQSPAVRKADLVKLQQVQEKLQNASREVIISKMETTTFNEQILTQKLIKNLLEDGVEKVLIDRLFNPIQLKKITEDENRITFECSDFTADQIINKFQSSLVESCKESAIELIFLAKNRFDEVREIKITEKGKW